MNARRAGVLLLAFALSLSAPAYAAQRRGSVAFHYGGAMTPAQLAWCGRFDFVVTHDPLPPAQVKALHRQGARLVLYEWAVAFYASLAKPGSWEASLLTRRRGLLNDRPLRGGSGATDADAFYYDPATREHAVERPAAIAARLRAIDYDGVFLDTTTAESVHPAALATFQQRHAEGYDAAFAEFLRNLRRELDKDKRGVIITNQGYRAADDVLPFVDADVSESLITLHGNFRPWNDRNDRWNSIDYLMRHLIAPVQKRYPRVRFVHLNYVATIEDAERVLAIARLYDMDAFAALPSITPILIDDYFRDFGKPLTPIHREKEIAWRRFEHGTVKIRTK
ncbi:MAG TPA: hypothetical protein VHX14_13275 [Thermoanaerobaculia bacterium]|nr:hypothetical protein [Thermoanaerobaculia bacterium]